MVQKTIWAPHHVEEAPGGREEVITQQTAIRGLAADVGGRIGVAELLSHGGSGEGYDQGNGEEKLFH